MAQQHSEFENVLVIHFGQLGDVVLGLPALRAIRERFADARVTLLVGKATVQIAKLANVADEYIVVDRVELRDGNKLHSIGKILRLVREIRSRKFDLVIDLHSLSETNLLGFLAGIKHRLYANRKGRSLDRLSNFPVKPLPEDRMKHAAIRYMDVIRPLGIYDVEPVLDLEPAAADIDELKAVLEGYDIAGASLVGMFLGAGHPSRRWPLQKYAELAARLAPREDTRILVFLGPEELDLLPAVRDAFPPSAVILDELKLLPLFAALSFLKVLVSNDTGPTHLAAATSAWIVLISQDSAPNEFLPLTNRLCVIRGGRIDEIGVDEVYNAVRSGLENDI